MQLAVLPGHKKPVDIDSFLRPIVDEFNDLATNGLLVKRSQREICRAKVYLMMASGDIPAVAAMAHLPSHTHKYGCRICEVVGEHGSGGHGMYFAETDADLRPLSDFSRGNHVSNLIS